MGSDGLPPIEVKKRFAAFAKEKRPSLRYYADVAGFGYAILEVAGKVLKCLEEGVEFVFIPSRYIFGLGYREGWGDVFMPIFREEKFNLLDKAAFFLVRLIFFPFSEYIRAFKFFSGPPYRVRGIRVEAAPITKTYRIPGYDRPLSYLEAKGLVLREMWKYTPEVEEEIRKRRRGIKLLPGEYIAIHVRRGDRITTGPYVEVSRYVKCMQALMRYLPMKKKVFLMTDDYQMLGEVKQALPGWEICTLATPDDNKGYDIHAWAKGSPAYRRAERLQFLTELTIARDAQYFFGTITSNVFSIISALRKPNTCFYMDTREGLINTKVDHNKIKMFDALHAEAAALQKKISVHVG